MNGASFDVVIVGGGPGGYVAGIRAAQLGMSAAIVEREHLGGVCLNWGCIPTKTLLRTAEIFRLFQRAGDFGLAVEGVQLDLERIVARSRAVAERLSKGIEFLLKKNRVQVLAGHGRLAGRARVAIEKEGKVIEEVTAKHVILATGARPKTLPGIEPDGRLVWTYREAMVPRELPQSVLVLGSGAIGVEFASFYRTLGAEVTVIEVLPRILPFEDEEISSLARRAFEKQGIRIHTSATVTAVKKGPDSVTASVDFGGGRTGEITASRLILAVGIAANTEGIGLEDLGVAVRDGHVEVDPWLETSVPGIFAIGDVAGPPWLAHKASHEGIVCVERLAGVEGVRPLDRTRIPACTYGIPQIASVGLTEAAAREAGYTVRVGRFPYTANGKAIALGETEGLVKTVFDAATGELLGAHMIGADVTELIQGFAVAKTLETTEAELIETVFPHPTVSEAMRESVLAAFGRAIHI